MRGRFSIALVQSRPIMISYPHRLSESWTTMGAPMHGQTVYKCPSCQKTLPDGLATPTFPFCSSRCKLIDLGNWFDSRYTISEPISPYEMDPEETDSEPE